jgi:2-haloacid dehalogenase
MEDIFISEQAGVPKPQKGFFDYCMEHTKEKDKSRILIVGDSLTSDIKGGVLYGIPTCWYRPDGAENNTPYVPDFEISDLHEIEDIILGR